MRSEAEIRARLAELQADERLSYWPANICVNAPLALIQVDGNSSTEALRWVMGEVERCAGSFPSRLPKRRMGRS